MTDHPRTATPAGEHVLSLASVAKRFDRVVVVADLSLAVIPGELLALLGPSGCGKTTALRLIAGLEVPDSGSITIGSQVVAGPGVSMPPEKRRVGMVFQDFALFPHLTVAENVAFGMRGWDRRARAERLGEVLEMVRLPHLGGRYPHELSGGEQQRVAVARAMAPRPLVLLLDEPLSDLDPALRVQVRGEVKELLKASGTAAVFVTHDQEEALFVGDRVAVMREGRVEQVGHPEHVFDHPETPFVAAFLGQADLVPATVTDRGLLTEGGHVEQAVPLAPGTRVEVMVRPDDVAMSPRLEHGDAAGKARVVARWFQGVHYLYRVALPSGTVVHSLQPHTVRYAVGTPVAVRLEPDHPLTCFVNGQALSDPRHASHA